MSYDIDYEIIRLPNLQSVKQAYRAVMGLSNSRQKRPQDSPSREDTNNEAATAGGKGQVLSLLKRLKGRQTTAEEGKNSSEAPSLGLPALPEQDHAAAEDHVQAYGICQPLGSYFNAHVDSFRIARQGEVGRAPDCKPEAPVEGHPNSRLGPKLNAKTVTWGQSSAIGVPRSPFASQGVEESSETTPSVSDRQEGKQPDTLASIEGEDLRGAVSTSTTSNFLSGGKKHHTEATRVCDTTLSLC